MGTYSIDDSIPIFNDYAASYPAVYPDKEYRIAADSYVRYEDAGAVTTPEMWENYENVPGGGNSILTTEEALVEYEVNIEESGYYDMSMVYYPVEGKSSSIQRSFFIDGKLPYGELALVELNRVWNNDVTEFKTDENGILVKAWEKDNQGFDVKPGTVETPEWVESYLYDSNG